MTDEQKHQIAVPDCSERLATLVFPPKWALSTAHRQRSDRQHKHLKKQVEKHTLRVDTQPLGANNARHLAT